MRTILSAEGIGFRRGEIDVLSGVSLQVRAGRLMVLIGPNGAGKSTLLKMLSGELAPTIGHVFLNGKALRSIPPWRLASIRAVLPQSVSVTLPFTAREIVRLGCESIGRGLPRREHDTLVEAALTQADAGCLSGRVIHTLSGGEQQRVHVARVLCQLAAGRRLEPNQALLLDEPIAGLDLRHQIGLLDHATALASTGTAVFAILHDLNLACAYANELVLLDGGRIVAQGAPAQVLTDARLADTFGVRLKVGAVPPASVPFVLPAGPRSRS